MLPLLSLLDDGQQHKFADLVPVLEGHSELSDSERAEMLPSGRVTTFRSRMHWAATYMAHAGLLQRPHRGWLQLTERGRHVLDERPETIDNKYLNQFREFRDFRRRSGVKLPEKNEPIGPVVQKIEQLSPVDSLVASYRTLRAQLADDLLQRLRTGSPSFFEQVVVDLLVAMGYGGSRPSVAKAIGKSGDEGIDGIINEDKLGLDVVYIQAKRWVSAVGSPVVHAFIGSLEGKKASKGVLITTSTFTKDAQEFVGRIGKRVVLINGEELAEFMIDHDVGVTVADTYIIKRIDSDYFEEE